MAELKRQKLIAKVEALGLTDEAQRNNVVCALIGHSRIIEMCFGYVHCGRCGTQIGDTLAGAFDGSGSVIIGHNCDMCRENYKKLTWKDKIYCPNPFKKQKQETTS